MFCKSATKVVILYCKIKPLFPLMLEFRDKPWLYNINVISVRSEYDFHFALESWKKNCWTFFIPFKFLCMLIDFKLSIDWTKRFRMDEQIGFWVIVYATYNSSVVADRRGSEASPLIFGENAAITHFFSYYFFLMIQPTTTGTNQITTL